MKVQQLSVFLENKPGQLKRACDLLTKANINILTLSLADTKQFGILRLIIGEWERAKSVLAEDGYVVKTTEVLALEVADRPGGLNEVLAHVDASGLNVEYMYAFAYGREGKAVMIFRFDDADKALDSLKAAGVNVIGGVELYSR
ncbi:MAG: amino acid-binding protein [Anaerolineae bacterium]